MTIRPVSSEIISNVKARKRKGTGCPFSHAITDAGSKLEGFCFSSGTCFFSSTVFPFEEDSWRTFRCSCLTPSSGLIASSGLTASSGSKVVGGEGSLGDLLLGFCEEVECDDFLFLGDDGGLGVWGLDWEFFLAAARAPDMRASKAEGGFDMARRGAGEIDRGKEKREETLTLWERQKEKGKEDRRCNASINE